MTNYNGVFAVMLLATAGVISQPALAQSPMSADAPPPKPMASPKMAPKPSADMQVVLSA